MHTGHRQRVLERMFSEGLEHFEPHQVLELLLFYALPRQDTNEIAHALIDKFGSLPAVFDADVNELKKVKGIGEHSASLIKLIPEISRRYLSDKAGETESLTSLDSIGRYVATLFTGVTCERVYLLLFDNAHRLIECIHILDGSVNSMQITPRVLIEKAIKKDASGVVIAHNHPNGIAVPSGEDLSFTHQMTFAFDAVGIDLIEHFVVAESKYTPIKGGKFKFR